MTGEECPDPTPVREGEVVGGDLLPWFTWTGPRVVREA